jgi:hypothetical protein
MRKTIVVTGDLLLQENLFITERGTAHRAGAHSELEIQDEREGAWRLADFVRVAVEEPENADWTLSTPLLSSAASRAVVVWAPFPPEQGQKFKPKDRIWRIEKHLGIKRQMNPESPSYDREAPASPDILVIEDLALGFRDTPEIWPAALGEGVRPTCDRGVDMKSDVGATLSIILATREPLFEGALWGKLLKEHRDRLTVIVPVDALRSYGAAIRAPLSWDMAIEQTATELLGDRFASSLARVRRVVVVFGTDGAASFTRLPLDGVPGDGLSERVRFERFLYDPEFLEGTWTAKRPGVAHNTIEIVTAALVRHELDPASYPLYVAVGRALAAARESHASGAGRVGNGRPDLSTKNLGGVLHPKDGEPAATYFSAFPHGILDDPQLGARPATQSDLLEDFTGVGLASIVSTGIDVVFRGPDIALKPVPKANLGKYYTVDRSEIERLNSIRNLMVTYLNNPKDDRPLSFAVFGPPGSGKSFAVRELMRDVAGDSAASYSFNLSQMRDISDLHQAFHRIRDASTRSQTPFVFWDESDTAKLGWLKDFLCPMQDAEFHAGGIQHPFGKAIFVFAGGTSASLAEFDKKPGSHEHEVFNDKKGPDFVSRQRGHIDVKGPNPEKGVSGHAHVIRRAIMLRKNLEKHAPHLVDPITKHLAVDASIVRAFLTATNYQHGARSIESIISMSNLTNASRFGAAELPSPDLLKLHVTDDFEAKVKEPALGLKAIEALADYSHEAYRATIVRGPELNPNDVPFADLAEDMKESGRSGLRSTLVALAALGYRLVRCTPGTQSVATLPDEQHEPLRRLEHDRWLRERLQKGWAYGKPSNRALRLNENVLPFDKLPPKVHPLDFLAVETILKRLPALGYAVVKPEQDDTHS